VNVKRYLTTGQAVCRITGKNTQIPDPEWYEIPSTSQLSVDFTDNIPKALYQKYGLSLFEGVGSRISLESASKKRKPEINRSTTTATTTTTTTSAANVTESGSSRKKLKTTHNSDIEPLNSRDRHYLNIRDTIAPFNSTSIVFGSRKQSHNQQHHQQRDNHNKDKTSGAGRGSQLTKTKPAPRKNPFGRPFGGKFSRQTNNNNNNNNNLNTNDKDDDESENNAVTNDGDSQSLYPAGLETDRLTEEDRRVWNREMNRINSITLKSENLGNVINDEYDDGDDNNDASHTAIVAKAEDDETTFQYFSILSNVTKLNVLYTKARENSFLGLKSNRIRESQQILRKLFYSDERKHIVQTKALSKKHKCVKELYQYYSNKLSSAVVLEKEGRDGTWYLDILEGLPIVAKYYSMGNLIDADGNDGEEPGVRVTNLIERDYASLKENKSFVQFFGELCWLQWNVICASPFGMASHKKYSIGQSEQNMSSSSSSLPVLSQQQQKVGGPSIVTDSCVNFTNCCLSVLYDTIGGQIISGNVVIPNLRYTTEHAPPITEVAKYGFKKKMLTKGVTQRTAAYKSLRSVDLFDTLCKFDFNK
jgi:hypothetical protein